MPRAYDPSLIGNQLPINHDPTSRIDYQAAPKVSLDDLIDQVKTFLTTYLIPAFEDLTGLDLSAITALISNFDFSSVEGFLTSVIELLLAIPETLWQLAQPILQFLVDVINRAFGGLTGVPMEIVGSLLQGVNSAATEAFNFIQVFEDMNKDMWAVVQEMGSTLLQVVQGTSEAVLLKPLELLQSLWFWVTGWFNLTTQSNSDSNPALAKTNGRLAQFEALLINNTAGGGDDFTDPTMAKWAAVGGLTFPPVITGGHWSNGSNTRAAKWAGTTTMPVESVTGKYKAYAAVTDFGYGKSRLIVQSNTAFTNLVILQVERSGGGCDISVNTGNTVNTAFLSQRDLHHLSDGDLKDLDVLGVKVDETAAGGPTYRMLRNDNDIGGWQDTSAVIGTGVAHRRMALATNIDNNSFFPGCGWETFGYADIP